MIWQRLKDNKQTVIRVVIKTTLVTTILLGGGMLVLGYNKMNDDDLHKELCGSLSIGDAQQMQKLIEDGIDPNEMWFHGNNLLMQTIEYRNDEAATALLANGARTDIKNDKGEDAIAIARRSKCKKTLGLLMAMKRTTTRRQSPEETTANDNRNDIAHHHSRGTTVRNRAKKKGCFLCCRMA